MEGKKSRWLRCCKSEVAPPARIDASPHKTALRQLQATNLIVGAEFHALTAGEKRCVNTWECSKPRCEQPFDPTRKRRSSRASRASRTSEDSGRSRSQSVAPSEVSSHHEPSEAQSQSTPQILEPRAAPKTRTPPEVSAWAKAAGGGHDESTPTTQAGDDGGNPLTDSLAVSSNGTELSVAELSPMLMITTPSFSSPKRSSQRYVSPVSSVKNSASSTDTNNTGGSNSTLPRPPPPAAGPGVQERPFYYFSHPTTKIDPVPRAIVAHPPSISSPSSSTPSPRRTESCSSGGPSDVPPSSLGPVVLLSPRSLTFVTDGESAAAAGKATAYSKVDSLWAQAASDSRIQLSDFEGVDAEAEEMTTAAAMADDENDPSFSPPPFNNALPVHSSADRADPSASPRDECRFLVPPGVAVQMIARSHNDTKLMTFQLVVERNRKLQPETLVIYRRGKSKALRIGEWNAPHSDISVLDELRRQCLSDPALFHGNFTIALESLWRLVFFDEDAEDDSSGLEERIAILLPRRSGEKGASSPTPPKSDRNPVVLVFTTQDDCNEFIACLASEG